MDPIFKSSSKWLLWGTLVAGLSACGPANDSEIHTWIQEQRIQIKPRIVPVIAPKEFIPEQFKEHESIDPYSPKKLSQALQRDAIDPKRNPLLAQEINRKKSPLEDLPLDVITMTGVIKKGGVTVGLVKADGQLFQVKTGHYLGQNYGKVINITGREITLRELAQNAIGEWGYRTAILALQEASK